MSPKRPVNVRMIKGDGTVIPCELAYQGRDSEGCYVWAIMTQFNLREGDRLEVEKWPRRTVISMPTRDVWAP